MDFLHAKRLILFLSTPSGWRATTINANCPGDDEISIHALRVEGDYINKLEETHRNISIHALRVEGDLLFVVFEQLFGAFLSTPSGWRATLPIDWYGGADLSFLSTPSGWRATAYAGRHWLPQVISIHALRVEGDIHPVLGIVEVRKISIHALRVEGDKQKLFFARALIFISIHALRVEGDNVFSGDKDQRFVFLSTPSGWRATAKTDKVFICFCAKGRRICLFKTRKEKNLPVAF